ncbi:MAG: glycosyltransferase family 4 protein [Pseudomonadota bacterium]
MTQRPKDLVPIVFALPGKLTDMTGVTLYDRHLTDALRDLGHSVEILELSGAFPEPDAEFLAQAMEQFASVPPEAILIVDGLALGALPADGLRRIVPRIVAMLHHPLGLEPGLAAVRAQALIQSERAALDCAAHILVPSPHVARTVQELFAISETRISIARPGIAPIAGTPTRAAPSPASPPLILSVGLLHRRKGHDILLSALSQITDIDWQAKIIGRDHDPDEAARLRARAREGDLADRVTLAGEVSAEAVSNEYQHATLFALATRYEGYGLVFDEALMHGLPIVSCQAGAVPDTVPADAGILVPPDNPEAFAKALREVLTQPSLQTRLSQAARSAGRDLPAWRDTAASVSMILNRLAGEAAAH